MTFPSNKFKHSILIFLDRNYWTESIKILGFSGNILCYFLQVFKKSLSAKIVSCGGHLNYYGVIAGLLQVVMVSLHCLQRSAVDSRTRHPAITSKICDQYCQRNVWFVKPFELKEALFSITLLLRCFRLSLSALSIKITGGALNTLSCLTDVKRSDNPCSEFLGQ